MFYNLKCNTFLIYLILYGYKLSLDIVNVYRYLILTNLFIHSLIMYVKIYLCKYICMYYEYLKYKYVWIIYSYHCNHFLNCIYVFIYLFLCMDIRNILYIHVFIYKNIMYLFMCLYFYLYINELVYFVCMIK